MASSLQGALVVPRVPAASRYRLLDNYFYFAMSLLIAAIVVAGFSRTVNQNLFHPAVPRPFLLWIHAAAFTLWIVFFILQSALVRVRKVKWHRLLGWFGAGLAAVMVPLGFTIAIVMGRFDKHIMHVADANTFLSIPFGDMAIFSVLVGLAIYWRRMVWRCCRFRTSSISWAIRLCLGCWRSWWYWSSWRIKYQAWITSAISCIRSFGPPRAR